MTVLTRFEVLCREQRESYKYLKIKEVLEWDQSCNMPEAGAGYRGELMGFIEKSRHLSWTSSAFEQALSEAESEVQDLPESAWEKRQTALSRKKFNSLSRIPASFSESYAKKQAIALATWEKARREKTFLPFQKGLTEITEANREKANFLGFEDHPYDALLQSYEFGFNVKDLDQLFNSLTKLLRHFIQEASKGHQPVQLTKSSPTFNPESQRKLCESLARQLGFRHSNGVLTTSSHPFSATLGQGDYRITTRYQERDYLSSFFAVAHEMGHSMYEQGLPPEWWGLEIGQAASCGIHESQSLFWEHRICGSKEFLRPWYHKFSENFSKETVGPTFDHFIQKTREVKPGLIRVISDEVCYCLHIVIRYEIEKKLIEGSLKVSQIPEIWNDLYKSYLGISPENDAEGCLQDIHWSFGEFGYFPSYALGHLYSAQIAEVMKKEMLLPESSPMTAKTCDLVRAWLTKNIHQKASLSDPLDLIEHISGQPLSTQFFENYLKEKYQFS